MFLLIHLLTGLPLLLCSIAAGCCKSRSAIRSWTLGAMLMPSLFWGGLGFVLLLDAEWQIAWVVAIVLLLCYVASRVIRFVVFNLIRLLTEPQDAGDAANVGAETEHHGENVGDGGGNGGNGGGGGSSDGGDGGGDGGDCGD